MKKFIILIVTLIPFLVQAQGWPDNYDGVMLQAFSWNSFGDTRWTNLTRQADEISQYFDLIWIPQSGWTGSTSSMGYDVRYYFNQRSAFGSANELRELISTYKDKGTGMIADVVLNHRGSLNSLVEFPVETYNGVTYQMTAADICKDDDCGSTAIWLAEQQELGLISDSVSLSANNDEGEDWDGMRDIDHKSENVRNIFKAYVNFLLNDLGYTGFRYDMTRGYWANRVAEYNAACGVQFSVGENWSGQNDIQSWIDNCKWNDVNMSASFDFPFRYTVRDVVRGKNDAGTKKTWKDLTIGGLMSTSQYKRYSVTFVENHDTQYRDENEQNDPLRADTLAANAYLLTMPGTPCVFLPHWKDYKQEIKNMIDVRKAVGITNTSTAQKYTISKDYEMAGFKSSGANGKSMYCVVGKNKHTRSDNLITNYYATILSEAVEVTKGYGYRLFMSKNCETAWVDKASGKYNDAFDAKLTAVTATSGARLVYTLDGSDPTASSAQVASGGTVHITQPCILKVGILTGSSVNGIVTREYDFFGQGSPRTINIYVNADEVGWSPVRYYTWDNNNVQHNGNWPGEIATDTTVIGGKTWYVKQYEIANDDCFMNFVFNTGASGSPSTVDVMYADTDKFYMISSEADSIEGKYFVNDVSSYYQNEISLSLNINNAILGASQMLTVFPSCTPDVPVELVVTSSDPNIAEAYIVNRANDAAYAGTKAIMIVGVRNGSATITVTTANGNATPAVLDLRVVDVDGDGSLTVTDITCIYNYLLNGDETFVETSDIDGDGYITTTDITIIYNLILGD